MIRRISLVGVTSTLVLSLLFWLFGAPQQAMSCLFGGTLMTVNLIVLVWALRRIFQKKSVAFAALVIVIKYTVWLGLFILLYSSGWQVDAGFVVGLAALFPTLGYLAYQFYKKSELHGSL